MTKPTIQATDTLFSYAAYIKPAKDDDIKCVISKLVPDLAHISTDMEFNHSELHSYIFGLLSPALSPNEIYNLRFVLENDNVVRLVFDSHKRIKLSAKNSRKKNLYISLVEELIFSYHEKRYDNPQTAIAYEK